jgi:hypothetical protein
MNLLVPFAAWAVVALIVVVLVIYRYSVARKDDGVIHVAASEAQISSEQVVIAKRLEIIDRWGKILTVLVILSGLALAGAYAYQVWVDMASGQL